MISTELQCDLVIRAPFSAKSDNNNKAVYFGRDSNKDFFYLLVKQLQ